MKTFANFWIAAGRNDKNCSYKSFYFPIKLAIRSYKIFTHRREFLITLGMFYLVKFSSLMDSIANFSKINNFVIMKKISHFCCFQMEKN